MVIVVLLLFVSIGMPLFYAWRIWRLAEASQVAWLVIVADAAVFVALVVLVGRWDITGYYVRWILLALFLLAVVVSWRRHADLSWRAASGTPVWRSNWATLASLVAFGAALVYVVTGLLPPSGARDMTFPLRGGDFMVAQGGTIALLNHHASHPAQRYASDITAIGAAGFRALGILPKALDRYAIWGVAVVSPCRGEVAAVVDGLRDLVPPHTDPAHPAGNHVVLSCGDVQVELAHLQENSVSVAPGDSVESGDIVGRVGNSGNTTEPHLHIHAVDPRTRTGVPLSFDGRVPWRNRVYRN